MGEHREIPHRKNLVEWVMYLVLLPFVPFAWLLDRLKRRRL